MMKRKLVSILIIILTFSFLVGFVSVNAVFTGNNWIEEITTLPSGAEIDYVEVDSKGRVYVGDLSVGVWRSLNRGLNWTSIGGFSAVSSMFVDSRDYLYVESNSVIYRSTDYGASFHNVSNTITWIWHWDEDSTGRVYCQDYDNIAPTTAYVYRSNTTGGNFTVWYNLTGSVWHLHTVDVAPNDYVFVSTGDTHRGTYNASVRRWNSSAWEIICQSNQTNECDEQRYAQPTDFWFLDNYTYLGCDQWRTIIRMPTTGTWSEHEHVLDVVSIDVSRSIFESVGIESEGIVLFTDENKGSLMATWDGERYVKLWVVDNSDGIDDISQYKGYPFYFTSMNNGRLFRISYLSEQDLIHLFYGLYNQKRGLIVNGANYTLEQRITNGTNYLDLTTVGLSNVQATMIGLDKQRNFFNNSGFETGDLSDWSIPFGAAYMDVTSEEKYEGSYALNSTTTTSSAAIDQTITVYPHETLLLCWAFVANETGNNFSIAVSNMSDYSTVHSEIIKAPTIWMVYRLAIGIEGDTSFPARVRFNFMSGGYKMWFDASILRVPEAGYLKESLTDDSIAYHQDMVKGYETCAINSTKNPALTIGGQQISHIGTLSNGTESSTTALTGYLAGTVKVEANIQGSGQLLLKVNGTRILYEDSIILHGRGSNAYYGSYYGTFSPNITTNEVVIVTNLKANITTASYSTTERRLKATVDGPFNVTSMLKIYVGNLGTPASVFGNGTKLTTWSFDNVTTICSLNITHSTRLNVELFLHTTDVFTVPLEVFGVAAVAGAGLIIWYWRRKKKTRTVSVP